MRRIICTGVTRDMWEQRGQSLLLPWSLRDEMHMINLVYCVWHVWDGEYMTKREKRFNFTTGSSLRFDKKRDLMKIEQDQSIWHATAERLQDRGVTNWLLKVTWRFILATPLPVYYIN